MDRLEDLDEYLMDKVPKPVQDILFNPKAPKQMKIYDPVLGTLEKLVFVLIAVGVVLQTARDPVSGLPQPRRLQSQTFLTCPSFCAVPTRPPGELLVP